MRIGFRYFFLGDGRIVHVELRELNNDFFKITFALGHENGSCVGWIYFNDFNYEPVGFNRNYRGVAF